MTMKYLGVYPESQYKGEKYKRKYSHCETHRGKRVDYYEIVEIEEVNTDVPLKKVKDIDELFRLVD